MRLVAGDEAKESLKERGLTFDMILASPVLDFIPNLGYPGQMLLILDIGGYVHAAPCEQRGDVWRVITAFPSRKFQRLYRP